MLRPGQSSAPSFVFCFLFVFLTRDGVDRGILTRCGLAVTGPTWLSSPGRTPPAAERKW